MRFKAAPPAPMASINYTISIELAKRFAGLTEILNRPAKLDAVGADLRKTEAAQIAEQQRVGAELDQIEIDIAAADAIGEHDDRAQRTAIKGRSRMGISLQTPGQRVALFDAIATQGYAYAAYMTVYGAPLSKAEKKLKADRRLAACPAKRAPRLGDSDKEARGERIARQRRETDQLINLISTGAIPIGVAQEKPAQQPHSETAAHAIIRAGRIARGEVEAPYEVPDQGGHQATPAEILRAGKKRRGEI